MGLTDYFPEFLHPSDNRFTPQPPPTESVCDAPLVAFVMNEHWASHVIGQILRLTRRDAWVGTDDEVSEAIDSVYKILESEDYAMGCGCGGSSLPFPTRIGENGQVQVSYDGGVTWQDAPQYDPRTNVTQLPPITEGTDDEKKCAYANSAVAFFQDMQHDAYSKRQAGATVAAIAEAIIAFLIVVGIIATGGALAALGGALAAIAAAASASDFNAAFSSAVWADLLCAIYCNMSADGSISDEQYQTIIGKAKTDHAGIAGDFLAGAIQMVGLGGLINASRLGMNAGLSCGSCDCGPCPYYDFTVSDGGWVAEADHDGAPAGTWVLGGGWKDRYDPLGGTNNNRLMIKSPLIVGCDHNTFKIGIRLLGDFPPDHVINNFQYSWENGGFIGHHDNIDTSGGSGTLIEVAFTQLPDPAGDRLHIQWNAQAADAYIEYVFWE